MSRAPHGAAAAADRVGGLTVTALMFGLLLLVVLAVLSVALTLLLFVVHRNKDNAGHRSGRHPGRGHGHGHPHRPSYRRRKGRQR